MTVMWHVQKKTQTFDFTKFYPEVIYDLVIQLSL